MRFWSGDAQNTKKIDINLCYEFHININNIPFMNKLISAIDFAAVAHMRQRRKDAEKTPYINHPIEVMHILSNAGINDIDILCGAVLHDTIEDCGITYDQIYEKFGKRVADFVAECSDDKTQPKVTRKKQQIEHAKTISIGAKLIKSADKLSNIKSLAHNPPVAWTDEEVVGYLDWSYAVHLGLRGNNSILDTQLETIFSIRNLSGISQEELDARVQTYYDHIG